MKPLAPHLGIRILGHGRTWPERAVSNADLLARHPRTRGKPRPVLEAMGKRLEARFGIGRRYLTRLPGETPEAATTPEAGTTPEETSESLALGAARQAVAHQPGRAVGALVHGTTTSSRYTGSQAPVILAALDSHAAGYEIKAGCSTSLASLHLAFSLLSLGHDDVLVSCAETLSKVMHPDLRDTWFVLADGGAAVWMQRDDDAPDFEIRRLLYHTDGRHAELFTTHGKLPPTREALEAGGYALFGDGAALRAQALLRYRMMLACMFPGGAGLDRIRWLIPHQVNRGLIIDALYRDTPLDAALVWSADAFGNLGGTSVLFSLAEALAQDRFRPGDELLLASVGGGLSFAMQHWIKR
jgi:3-oxoacyl-[acyl-carrier-protein] synthase III